MPRAAACMAGALVGRRGHAWVDAGARTPLIHILWALLLAGGSSGPPSLVGCCCQGAAAAGPCTQAERRLGMRLLHRYQQLIRSKDVPSSVTAALGSSGGGGGINRAGSGGVGGGGGAAATDRAVAMAAAMSFASAGAGGAAADAKAGSAAPATGTPATAAAPTAGPAAAGPPARTPPPPLLRSPSVSTEAMAASKNQPLAEKLASLETMWVASGQAARSPTPRRAQAAAQVRQQTRPRGCPT